MLPKLRVRHVFELVTDVERGVGTAAGPKPGGFHANDSLHLALVFGWQIWVATFLIVVGTHSEDDSPICSLNTRHSYASTPIV